MPDTAPKDFSTTAASNSTVGGINIAEGMTAAQINDALRAICAVIANPDFGTLSFKADTIAESTADTGVTIDGLLIKDGALPGLTLGDTIPVGTVAPYIGTSAPSGGWLVLNGDTIGSTASSADQNDDDLEDLFTLFWNSMANSEAAVSGGRGASAAADWAANKTLTMPDTRGRAVIGTGTGSGLTARTHGDTDGVESVTLTAAQSGLPEHTHHERGSPNTDATSHISRRGSSSGDAQSNSDTGGIVDGPQAASESHTNMPPWLALTWVVKY